MSAVCFPLSFGLIEKTQKISIIKYNIIINNDIIKNREHKFLYNFLHELCLFNNYPEIA